MTDIVYIGEKDTNRRVCRFCGRSISDGASFNNWSHAISEGLGNHNIFCLEECDECNSKFGNTIENDIVAFFSPALAVYEIRGKKKGSKDGLRSLRSEAFDFKTGDGVKLVTVHDNQRIDEIIEGFKGNDKGGIELDAIHKWSKYVPANVYKSLCKFIISVVKPEYLCRFSKTIDWINGTIQDDEYTRYSVIQTELNTLILSPFLAYHCPKDKRLPIYGIFAITNIGILFEIPYSGSSPQSQESRNQRDGVLRDICKQFFDTENASLLNLNSLNLTPAKSKFTISVDPSLIEGKDYFVAHGKKECEELIAKFSKSGIKPNG